MESLGGDVAADRERFLVVLGDLIERGIVADAAIAESQSQVAGVRKTLAGRWPTSACVVWGHMGDCNLHLWISVQDSSAAARAAVEQVVYGPLAAIQGSVSAEHGIGTEKARYLGLSRSHAELGLMRRMKQALDPLNLLNPGKVLE